MSPTDYLFCVAAFVVTVVAIGSSVVVALLARVRGGARQRNLALIGAGLQIGLLCGAPVFAWLALRTSLQSFGAEAMATYMFGPIALAIGTPALALVVANVVTALGRERSE